MRARQEGEPAVLGPGTPIWHLSLRRMATLPENGDITGFYVQYGYGSQWVSLVK